MGIILTGITYSQSAWKGEDYWSLWVDDDRLFDSIYTKEIGDQKHWELIHEVKQGQTIKVLLHNVSGNSRNCWVDIEWVELLEPIRDGCPEEPPIVEPEEPIEPETPIDPEYKECEELIKIDFTIKASITNGATHSFTITKDQFPNNINMDSHLGYNFDIRVHGDFANYMHTPIWVEMRLNRTEPFATAQHFRIQEVTYHFKRRDGTIDKVYEYSYGHWALEVNKFGNTQKYMREGTVCTFDQPPTFFDESHGYS